MSFSVNSILDIFLLFALGFILSGGALALESCIHLLLIRHVPNIAENEADGEEKDKIFRTVGIIALFAGGILLLIFFTGRFFLSRIGSNALNIVNTVGAMVIVAALVMSAVYVIYGAVKKCNFRTLAFILSVIIVMACIVFLAGLAGLLCA